MDYEKKIEIPFGAFDSELIHQEINIPKGFNAVIDGNKIILTKIESEDERIRKRLIAMCQHYIECYSLDPYNVDDYKEALAWIEKQGNSPIKWNKNTKDCKPQKYHSVLMQTTHGIAEGEWQGEHWHQYRWAGLVRDTDVLSWMELSDLEKQGEQKVNYTTLVETGNGGINALVTRELPTNGCDEQKPAWSAEDERKIQDCIDAVSHVNLFKVYYQNELVEWLKFIKERIGGLTDFDVIGEVVQRNLLEEVVKQMSDTLLIETLLYRKKQGTLSIFYGERKEGLERFLKSICTWKPSDEQIEALESATENCAYGEYQDCLQELIEQLKKLREDKL